MSDSDAPRQVSATDGQSDNGVHAPGAPAKDRSTQTSNRQGGPAQAEPGGVPASAAALPPRRRRWPVVALLIVAALAGGAWYVLSQSGEEQTQLVLQGNIDVRQVNLSFKVDGRLETLLVDEGDKVHAGQVLATLDKRYFHDELRVAQAARANAAAALAKLKNGSRPEEIAQAKAQLLLQQAMLNKARQDFKRAERLIQGNAISREDYDQYQASLNVSDANVKYAQETLRLAEIGPRQEDIAAATALLAQQDAALIQTERRLADSDLIAPGDGIILTRVQERGAILTAGSTVFTLTLSSPVWVRTYVNERDLGLIRPDMPAAVATDTSPDHPYAGHIGFISPTAEFTPKTVETRELRTDLVYRLRVIVDNSDGGLRQGMPVTVSLPLNHPRPRTLWERIRAALHLQRD